MTGKLFYLGQEVTPLVQADEWKLIGTAYGARPQYGKIYTVTEYELDDDDGAWMVTLKELHPDDNWDQEGFAPVLPADAIEELMEQSHEKEWSNQQYV